MLISQAVRSSELFQGRVCSKGLAEHIYSKILKEKENIVLTGMPSSGKTTVGHLVASELGRDLIDTDDMISVSEGMSPAQIITSRGEEYFREAETSVIKEVSKLSGKVIATGGGAVLKDENVALLRQNGRIYFLDRPLAALEATSDRPLSSDRASLEKRYSERIGIYNSVCDVRIDSSGTAEAAAKDVIDEFDTQEKI